jgi:ribose 5-phosphate isomerase RpiB
MAPGAPGALVTGQVELCTYLGAVLEHVVRIAPELAIVVRGNGIGADAAARHAVGTAVALLWTEADECLFDAADRPVAADRVHAR